MTAIEQTVANQPAVCETEDVYLLDQEDVYILDVMELEPILEYDDHADDERRGA